MRLLTEGVEPALIAFTFTAKATWRAQGQGSSSGAGDSPSAIRRPRFTSLEKTLNRPPSEIRINQPRLYAVASEQLGLEPVKLAVHDLEAEKGHRHVFENDDRERDAFTTRLEKWVEGIRSGDFHRWTIERPVPTAPSAGSVATHRPRPGL